MPIRRPPDRFPTELVKGSSELLVLGALSANGAPLHGYALMQRLRERSSERLRMNEGAVYPLLHRLAREKKLRVVEEQQGGRPRKAYAITAAGRRALTDGIDAFRTFSAFVLETVEEGA